MEIIAIQKYIHTSPRKLRLVADMVRKMQPERALTILQFTAKDAAKDLTKAIETALGNAKQQGLSAQQVLIKSLEINEGPSLKRAHAGTRGRSKPFKRRTSHIKIILTDQIVQREEMVMKKRNSKQEVMSEAPADAVKEEN